MIGWISRALERRRAARKAAEIIGPLPAGDPWRGIFSARMRSLADRDPHCWVVSPRRRPGTRRATRQELRAWSHKIAREFWYWSDRARQGESDYWQSPGETAVSMSGDCEDAAILAGHWALSAGIDPSTVYLVGVGAGPGTGVDHAVCVVIADDDRPYLVGDVFRPGFHRFDRTYRPSERFCWLRASAPGHWIWFPGAQEAEK